MIYTSPKPNEPLDQGDLIDGVVFPNLKEYDSSNLDNPKLGAHRRRGVVLTQTCDFANDKMTSVTVAEVFPAQHIIDIGLFKAADVRGPLRAGRIWGWYFLPADATLGLDEMAVDLRRLQTVRLDLLVDLCRLGSRLARIQTPYREHLAKHFADTFARIGLPRPYETL